MNDVTVIEPRDPMHLLAAAVAQGATPDALERLMGLQERWERNQAEKDFAAAVAQFQANCPQVLKDRQSNFGRYASLDDIMEDIKPHLAAAGLCVSFDVEMADSATLTVHAIISKGIHKQRTKFVCPVPDMKVNATQRMGAALSYAKRYALCAALNIVVTDEDTDADSLKPAATITEEQAVHLQDIAEQVPGSLAALLQWAQVESVYNLPAEKYAKALDGLKKKLAAKGGGK